MVQTDVRKIGPVVSGAKAMKAIWYSPICVLAFVIGALGHAAPAPVRETEAKEYATFSGHTDGIRSLSFSPDGKTLASAGRGDRSSKLWDVVHRKLLAT